MEAALTLYGAACSYRAVKKNGDLVKSWNRTVLPRPVGKVEPLTLRYKLTYRSEEMQFY